jgi:hypothetical protein
VHVNKVNNSALTSSSAHPKTAANLSQHAFSVPKAITLTKETTRAEVKTLGKSVENGARAFKIRST